MISTGKFTSKTDFFFIRTRPGSLAENISIICRTSVGKFRLEPRLFRGKKRNWIERGQGF